jgi:hypothetical protein
MTLHQRLCGARIHAATAVRGIDEGVQADLRDESGPLRGDLAQQHAEHALWEVVGLDLVRQRQRTELRREVPMPADDRLIRPLCARWFKPRSAAISLPGAVVEREIVVACRFAKNDAPAPT